MPLTLLAAIEIPMHRLVADHGEYEFEKTPVGMRRLMYRLGPDMMELLWELQLADVLSQHPDRMAQKLEVLEETKRLHRGVLERGDCVSLKELAINGRDLIAYGMKPGKEIGGVLETLLDRVLDCPEINQKEQLLGLLETM